MIGQDVVLKDLAEGIVSDSLDWPIIGIGSGAADQNVDLAEGAAGLIDKFLKLVLERDVSGDRHGVNKVVGVNPSGHFLARTGLA